MSNLPFIADDDITNGRTLRKPGRPAFSEVDKHASDRFEKTCSKFTLSQDHELPLWRQLAEQLETVIRNGELEPGSRIPSEAALALRFGISRPVVRNGLQMLVDRGLIVKLPRKGIFVGQSQPETDFITTNLAAYDDLVAHGHQVTVENFELYRSNPNPHECHRLQLSEFDTVVRIGRVFWMDDVPISLAHISFHGDKVPGLENANLENRPILKYIQQRYGRRLTRAERWLKAVVPPKGVTVQMRVTARTPMVWVESIAYEADNTPLEYYRAYYNSEIALIHLSVIG